MSRTSITLKADGRSVRSSSQRRFVLAIPHYSYVKMNYDADPLNPVAEVIPMDPKRLIIRVRTDNPATLVAYARKLARDETGRPYYLFDNATGTLIGTGNSTNAKRTGKWCSDVMLNYIGQHP